MTAEAKKEKKEDKKAVKGWPEQLRKFVLAGVGMAVIAQEEIEDFVNKLVEKGELAEKDGKKLVKDIVEKRKQTAEEKVKSVRSDIDKKVKSVRSDIDSGIETSIEKVLSTLSIPTKKDVSELQKKIDEIDKKIDKLMKSK